MVAEIDLVEVEMLLKQQEVMSALTTVNAHLRRLKELPGPGVLYNHADFLQLADRT